jgi:hypothetical protein
MLGVFLLCCFVFVFVLFLFCFLSFFSQFTWNLAHFECYVYNLFTHTYACNRHFFNDNGFYIFPNCFVCLFVYAICTAFKFAQLKLFGSLASGGSSKQTSSLLSLAGSWRGILHSYYSLAEGILLIL